MKSRLTTFILFITVFTCLTMAHNGVTGFVNYNDLGQFGVTGGQNGAIVHVSSRADFVKYVSGSTPYIIILEADITGGGMQDLQDEISVGSNKTIIGAGAGKALNGICLDLNGQKNLIFRNIKLTKGRTDGMSFRNCHHVWIDHCDLSDSYDGLLDFTLGSDYLTVTWTKIHNHDKVSIVNSGTCHYEDYGKEHATYAHCWFSDNVQRNPRIGYGKAHVYNCYWTNISSYCIGVHSQGQVLSEYNYFASTANKAFNNQYSTTLPYCGYITDNGSFFGGSNPKKSSDQPYTDISYTPATYYDFLFDQTDTASVPTDVQEGTGPKEGLAYEPILNPGNGAIEVPTNMRLTWHSAAGANKGRVMFGMVKDNLVETDINSVNLMPATTYYWKVINTVEGIGYESPVYQFTTASEVATNPYPADKSDDAWLRWPSSQYEFCTAMPLTWRQAFDAKSYNVYLSTSEADLDNNQIGTTSTNTFTPESLNIGTTYYWRVDAVSSDGSVIKGNTWTFSTPSHQLTTGKNEAEKMYFSGIVFEEAASRTYSGSKVSVGDQGPGSLIGTWAGNEGRYALTLAYRTETVGVSTFGISVNGKLIDKWYSATDKDGIATRQVRHTQLLKPGDEIRVEFIAGPKAPGEISEARARIDYLRIDANDNEILDAKRESGVPHSPVTTVGYECEYLPLNNIVFKDTLGNVGDYNSYQITDDYCSWISFVSSNADAGLTTDANGFPMIKDSEKITFYLTGTELAKFYTKQGNNVTAVVKDLSTKSVVDSLVATDSLSFKLDKTLQYSITISSTNADATLMRAELYKVEPVPFIYHKPETTTDYELIWSTAIVYLDSKGEKGVAGKVQIASPYDQWCQYYNPTANEVQAKNASNAVYYLDPTTDKACSRKSVPGGSGYCYVVGTEKSMTYYLRNCAKIKVYYTGSGGAAKALHLEVTDIDYAVSYNIQGGEAPGKAVASNAVETELDPTHKYKVKVIADKDGGDMLVYATKLWVGATTLLGDANDDGTVDVADITTIASYILGGNPSPFNFDNADVDADNLITVSDITATASIILK
ncbi:MAG: dockerin type I domain-containing protein [Prevotellaceae bacterium]|nr:dockerin type I domain-containing protein [Prevotellaceae bacterium]